MTEDERQILERFCREVFLPDFERIFDSLDGELNLLKRDMRAGFAEFHRRFDRLESEYLSLRTTEPIGDDFDAPRDSPISPLPPTRV